MIRPASLPVDAVMPRVLDALVRRGAVVLQAAPGAGKTTRVPQAMLEADMCRGQILVLEPRRIAARAAAARVARELGDDLGGTVGYQVRLESRISARTRIVFMTEGVLTRRLCSDRLLEGVGAVILDELHERHLHTDIALGLVAHLRRTRRPELKLVAMSATIDADPIAALLDAESIRCDVPAHPVSMEYAPSREPLETQVAVQVRRALREQASGHVLVFLPGTAEIRRAIERCGPLASQEGVRVLPLHGSLSAVEQDAAIAPSPQRKVIVSTNVAESSLTIEDVACVIDGGLARVAQQPPGSTMVALRTESISRASATQRAGRAGRTGPGRCIRLYSEFDFQTRPAFDVPEILRSDLSDVLLTVLSAGARPDEIPWLSPPSDAAWTAGDALLRQLGALDDHGLTPIGRRIATMPVHPRIGRVLLEAERLGLGEAGCAMGALLLEDISLGRDGGANFWSRLERFEEAIASGHGGRIHGTDDVSRGSIRSAIRSYQQLLRHVDARPEPRSSLEPHHALSLVLLTAFPDRVARRSGRSDTGPVRGTGDRTVTLTLCDGAAATVRDPSAVGGDGCCLVLDARGGAGGSSFDVTTAIPLRADWILEALGERVETESLVELNRDTSRVESIDRLRYGRIVLDESRSSAAGTTDGARALVDAFFARGLDRREGLEAVRSRARHASPNGLPGLDEAVRSTVASAAAHVASLDELAAVDLASLWRSEHPTLASELARLAPSFVRLPSGRDLPIQYPHEAAPFVESYLQDFFGMTASPRVGNVPIVMQLWAPNRRPVQVTSDLASFWKTTYPELRRSLMRRYPKHFWPEDPTDAKAVRFVKQA